LFRLYRAVSFDELADIAAWGGFRAGPNCLEGEWFAETHQAAQQWGQLLYQGSLFHVVQLDIPLDVADQMFRLPALDQIGPARFAEGDVLASINQLHQGIAEVPLSIVGGP
jgi:hypothetical protein